MMLVAPRVSAATSPVYTPAPGSAERAAIMEAIRLATGSTSVFVVRHLAATRDEALPLAYAEVAPAHEGAARPFAGWVLLAKRSGVWRVEWGVGSDGASSCESILQAYRDALIVAEQGSEGSQLFSKAFVDEMAELAAPERKGLACVGDIILPPDG